MSALRPLLSLSLAAVTALSAAGCNTDAMSNGKAPGAIGNGDDDTADPVEESDADADADADADVDTGEPPPDPLDVDADGDGFTPREGDCQDDDPTINPGAPDICDTIDNNCDGLSDADFDDDLDGLRDCADACPVQVAEGAATGADGTWERPFGSVQEGIDAAWGSGCPLVEVSDGTYYENIVFDGAPVHVRSHYGPGATVLDGGALGTVVTLNAAEGPEAGVEGFTITNGLAALGAGLYIEDGSPVIRDNIITGNQVATDGGGGGIGLRDASPLIEGNEISANDAGYGGPESGNDGGGINIRGGAPVIIHNQIIDNTAGDGGGIWLVRTDALITNNLIDTNLAYDTDPVQAGQGGGVDIQIGSVGLIFYNNVVTNNFASSHGGGVAVYEYSSASGSPTVAHNVIAFNLVAPGGVGGGLLAFGSTVPVFQNNLVYDNDPSGVHLNSGASARYNLVNGNVADWAGAQGSRAGLDGNVTSAPGVTAASDDDDSGNDDWTPASGSALINAGDPSSPTDADGSRADIGAYGGAYGAW